MSGHEEETKLSYIQNGKALLIADIKKQEKMAVKNSKDLFHEITNQH